MLVNITISERKCVEGSALSKLHYKIETFTICFYLAERVTLFDVQSGCDLHLIETLVTVVHNNNINN